MAVFKCKMCGGDLDIQEGFTTCECEYCGTKQTIPALDDEKKLTLFNRANKLRFACEFDKAAGVYESIVADFPEEAEGYWGLILCKYGIEYVDDPATDKKIPTCHRSSFDSLMDDNDFEMVMENADPVSRKVYREEAKAIEELRKGIVQVSSAEEPYDIFICYKETDENGDRTVDSEIAQDVYTALTDKGYRVFFSRISLEDRLGQEYEPYIFAALNSAKVMLAFGTDYEYYNAVWVKNEWSRFLKLIAKGEKKTLIPCYKNIDAYDMPKEFAKLQAQDMGKVGAIQDLVRGIEKLIPKNEPVSQVKETVVVNNGATATVDSLLKRVFMFLEDGEWQNANIYCEKVLDINPECAEAYLGKLMVEFKVKKQESLKNCANPFDNTNNYKKAVRFADNKLKEQLIGYIDFINTRNENARIEGIYVDAKTAMAEKTKDSYRNAIQLFESIGDYKDSVSLKEECFENLYEFAQKAMAHAKTEKDFTKVVKALEFIMGYKNSSDLILECKKKLNEINGDSKYEKAVNLLEKSFTEDMYLQGINILEELGDFKDSIELIEKYKQEWSSRNEIAMAAWSEYYPLKEKIISLEKERNQKLILSEEIQKKKDDLKNKLNQFKSNTDLVVSAKEEIVRLNHELSNLGVFSFSKKKEITANIQELNKKLKDAEAFLQKLNINEMKSLQKINEYEGEIAEYKNEISLIDLELNDLQVQLLPALEKLEDRKIIAALIEVEEGALLVLSEEDSIVNLIRADADLKYFIKTSEAFYLLPKYIQKSIFNSTDIDVEAVYFQACQAVELAKSTDDIKWARNEFASIKKYKDSQSWLMKCDEMIARNTYKI